jgi:fructosamine-3-kinase
MKARTVIAAQISEMTGRAFVPTTWRPLGGGCIHAAWEVSDGAESYFVKCNTAQQLDGFAVEAAGLRLIAGTQTVRVPTPLCCGAEDDSAWLVLEFLRLGRGDRGASLGEKLAAMHRCFGAHFGLDHDNVIGSTPQINQASDDWIEFWRAHRLGYQLRLAVGNGHGAALEESGQRLAEVFCRLSTSAIAPAW